MNSEDKLKGYLLHDVLVNVKLAIYVEKEMEEDFGPKVLRIVRDVSKDEQLNIGMSASKHILIILRMELATKP